MSNSGAVQSLPAIEASTYIGVSPEKVFKCLTTADGWNSWFTSQTRLDLKPGGQIWLVWKDWGVNHVDHQDGGSIIAIEENKKFAFHWHSDLGAQTSVAFELKGNGPGTILKVTDSGYRAEELSQFGGFLDCAIGWGEAITLLKFYLEHGVTYGEVPS